MKIHKETIIFAIAIFLILIFFSFTSILTGAVRFSFSDFLEIFSKGSQTMAGKIILHVRIPRLFAAILAGAGLSVSGLLIQTVLANPLASPGIIGVNSGAGLFVVACMAVFPQKIAMLPFAAFAGGMLAVFLVYSIASKTGASRITLILSGAAISSFMSAGTNTILTFYPDAISAYSSFQHGGFAGVSINTLIYPASIILVGIFLTIIFSAELDIIGLGENNAFSLGLNIKFYRLFFLAIASALAGSVVSFAGLIGFVGLIVPHMVRFLLKGAAKLELLAICPLLGAAFLTLCDLAARTIFAPFEFPVGIVVSFLGVPFFLWLLFNKEKGESK
ncbi:MAG: iron ABC transporter permease [Oscillospiraceae bacterium]|nr:iron ABC transporter permease [Oscillospiraceae bacterium]